MLLTTAYRESPLSRFFVRIVSAALGMFVAAHLVGCTGQQPMEPTLGDQPIQHSFNVAGSITAQPAQNGRNLSITQRVTVKDGATLRLGFTKNNGPNKFPTQVSVKLLFPPGAVQKDVNVTMTLDEIDLSMGIEMGFGPHGEVFKTPALLSITALNFDVKNIKKGNGTRFICVDDGQEMQYAELNMNEWNGKITLKDARIPHFSRYAFIRWAN